MSGKSFWRILAGGVAGAVEWLGVPSGFFKGLGVEREKSSGPQRVTLAGSRSWGQGSCLVR